MTAARAEPDDVPSQVKDLSAWTSAFKFSFPSVLDPTFKLGPYFNSNTPPLKLLITTRDMRIRAKAVGVAGSGFYAQIDSVLQGGAQ